MIKKNLDLFSGILQPSTDPEIIDTVLNFNVRDPHNWIVSYSAKELSDDTNFHTFLSFQDSAAGFSFLDIYDSETILPKDAIFTIYNEVHKQQAIALFKFFYYARNVSILQALGAWARQNINPYMFVYSYYVAFVHKDETSDLILPPIYEVFPNYFFYEGIIRKAQIYNQQLQFQSGNKCEYLQLYYISIFDIISSLVIDFFYHASHKCVNLKRRGVRSVGFKFTLSLLVFMMTSMFWIINNN